MGLRKQLAFPLLLLLLLPLVGWQVARLVEENLRESEQRALIAAAQSVASVIQRDRYFNLPALKQSGLYVHAIDYSIQVDGFTDDWGLRRDQAQVFESTNGLVRMSVLLASHGLRLYGIIRVYDQSVDRASWLIPDYHDGDHVLLALEDSRRMLRYRLMPGIGDSLAVMAESEGQQSAELGLRGSWQEAADGSGYLLEFSLPMNVAGLQLGLSAIDTGNRVAVPEISRAGTLQNRGRTFSMVPLLPGYENLSRHLNELLPQGARAWLLNHDGWVRGSSGQLNLRQDDTRSWLRGLVYRALAGSALSKPEYRDPLQHIRLSGSEVDFALAGRSSVRWQPATADYTVIASTAVPLVYREQTVGAVVIEQARDALLLAANRTFARTVLLSLLMFVLIGLVIFAFASILSWRIRRLRDSTEKALNNDEAFSDFPSAEDKDEIGDLSRSFSALLNQVTEYNHYLKDLGGRLSHELNTPLAIVRSSLENLAAEDLSEAALSYHQRARTGVDRLQKILRAMSESHRLEQAVSQFDPETFDLSDVVSGCYESYRQMSPNFDWQLNLPKEPTLMLGSPELIAQMMDKLVDNARSFAPSDGLIEIRLNADAKTLLLSVINDGPLLPQQLSGRLFDSLVSVREPVGKQDTHLGVGLHIVRLIVRVHRGRVKALNRTDRQGVVFKIGLPRKERQVPAAIQQTR